MSAVFVRGKVNQGRQRSDGIEARGRPYFDEATLGAQAPAVAHWDRVRCQRTISGTYP
jgi:hypothetical protein